jgi:transcriptional regulator with XRE-family HTH domain
VENTRRSERLGELRFRKPFVPRLEHQVALELVKLRFKMNLTQAEMAEKIGTTQSAVSRAESGLRMPSLHFLDKVAQAFDVRVTVKFEPLAVDEDQGEWLELPSKVIDLQEYRACHAPQAMNLTWKQPEHTAAGIEPLLREARAG